MVVLRPRCVGSTAIEGDDGASNVCHFDGKKVGSSIFYQAQFSADGTTLVTQHGDHSFRSYVLPPDLLDDPDKVRLLAPYASVRSPSAVQGYALFPFFNLQDYTTTVFLSASTDLPITLSNAITADTGFYKYPLINPTTEVYTAPKSLNWTRDGLHFVAGGRDQLSYFDVQANGSGPISTTKTSPGRRQKRMFGDLPICKGHITSLSISSDGTLAAGSTERQIALFSDDGAGECWTSFLLPDDDVKDGTKRQGTGIMQLAWSPCGTYLLAAERACDGIQVYDIRNTLQQVAYLSGRDANTAQRLGVNIVPTADGYEVWAGGTDGCVRMWKNAGSAEGDQAPEAQFKVHDDPVSSAVWHPQGSVLATCSGRRVPSKLPSTGSGESDIKDRPADNSLKIWTV